MECLPCAWHGFKCLTRIISFNLPTNPIKYPSVRNTMSTWSVIEGLSYLWHLEIKSSAWVVCLIIFLFFWMRSRQSKNMHNCSRLHKEFVVEPGFQPGNCCGCPQPLCTSSTGTEKELRKPTSELTQSWFFYNWRMEGAKGQPSLPMSLEEDRERECLWQGGAEFANLKHALLDIDYFK